MTAFDYLEAHPFLAAIYIIMVGIFMVACCDQLGKREK